MPRSTTLRRLPVADLFPRSRTREQITLPLLNPEILADLQLLVGLDRFSDRQGADRFGAPRDQIDETRADRILLQAVKQRMADFQVIGLQLRDGLERRVAGAAIVDRDLEAHRLQVLQRMTERAVVADGTPL